MRIQVCFSTATQNHWVYLSFEMFSTHMQSFKKDLSPTHCGFSWELANQLLKNNGIHSTQGTNTQKRQYRWRCSPCRNPGNQSDFSLPKSVNLWNLTSCYVLPSISGKRVPRKWLPLFFYVGNLSILRHWAIIHYNSRIIHGIDVLCWKWWSYQLC